MHFWIVTNARARRNGRLAASTLQNLQTGHALARQGHAVLLWVAELEGTLEAILRERLGLEPAAGLQALRFHPRGPQDEKKTPFGSWSARAVNGVRARRALGDWPEAIVTRSPRVLSQLRRWSGLPGTCRLVLEYQYPEFALLWRGWRRRNPDATPTACKERLRYWAAREREGVRLADGVLHASQDHRRLLRRFGYSGPTQWLPSGCQPPDAERKTPAEPVFDFGYLGSISPENGLETLIEAVGRLGRGRLLIQGGGEAAMFETLRLKAEKRNVDLTLAPAVDYRRVRGAMRLCAVGIAPISRRFGCEKRQYASPLKLIEWMAAGVPVVTTDVPSVRQLVENGKQALVVAPDEAEALSAAMGRLLDDTALRKRLVEAGVDLANRFTQDERARTIARFCETLATPDREAAIR
jgi:glycosyltransferase involved in cell wall biosynthesis